MTTELSPSMTLSVTRVPTMSSLEIAEITGKKHFHVMRDICTMLEDVKINQSSFGSVYVDAKGEERHCYRLPKDLTITLVAGYRADLRLRIVRRWMELEEANKVTAPALPNFNDPVLAALGDDYSRPDFQQLVRALPANRLMYFTWMSNWLSQGLPRREKFDW